MALSLRLVCAQAGPGREGIQEFGVSGKYEKQFKAGDPLPINFSKTRVIVLKPSADAYFDPQLKPWASTITSDEARKILSEYCVVRRDAWTLVSHVSRADVNGEIILSDKTQLKWMIRPAGIAAVIYPDGGIAFLLGCELARGK